VIVTAGSAAPLRCLHFTLLLQAAQLLTKPPTESQLAHMGVIMAENPTGMPA
jgi:hypothetical protein